MTMHIAHLETGRHLYGGARQVLYLLDGLAEHNVRSTLVCPPDSEIMAAANQAGHTVMPIAMAGDLDVSFTRRLNEWLRSAQPDLLHVHSRRGADIWGGMAARFARVPAVLSRRVDNPDVPVLGTIKYSLYAKVIAISEQIRTQLRASGLRDAQLRLARSAVAEASGEPAWTRAQFLAEFNLQENQQVVACVAQFIPRKGHACLLEAWRTLVSDCPDARLLLFGQGAEEQALRAQVVAAGLSASVHFAGFRPELADFLGHVDLLVHPALREGLGICLLEAQAAGVPVIASNAGGIPEAVADGVSGVLVPPDDAVGLGRVMVSLLNDEARRKSLGMGGPQHMAAQFSVAGMVSANLGVYREVLGE
jgi:glycosyltransferase involved in cell wall biosynthesis